MQTIKTILWRNLFGLMGMLILAVLLFRQCEKTDSTADNLTAVQTENATFKNQLGTITTQNRTLQFTNKQLEDQVIDKDQKLKALTKGYSKVTNITTIGTVAKIDTVEVPFEVAIPCSFSRDGAVAEEFYSFNYNIDSLGLSLENIYVPNQLTVVTGFKRKNIFSKQFAVTEVTSDNPLVEVTNLQGYQAVVPKKWYESILLWLATGLVSGALIFK